MRVPELIEVLRAELATFVDGRGTIRLQPIVDFPLVVLSPFQPDAEVFEVVEDAGLVRVVGREPVRFRVEFQSVDLAVEFCKGIVEVGVCRRAMSDQIRVQEAKREELFRYRSQTWGRRPFKTAAEP